MTMKVVTKVSPTPKRSRMVAVQRWDEGMRSARRRMAMSRRRGHGGPCGCHDPDPRRRQHQAREGGRREGLCHRRGFTGTASAWTAGLAADFADYADGWGGDLDVMDDCPCRIGGAEHLSSRNHGTTSNYLILWEVALHRRFGEHFQRGVHIGCHPRCGWEPPSSHRSLVQAAAGR